jgi:signal transduction histidine kinase/DNA-binding response OmpR family regulator
VSAASPPVRRARATTGIGRRRMAAAAWGCALLAATFVLSLVGQVLPQAALLAPLARVTALCSGLSFWAGFFPPAWLSQAWRLPELLEYLRPSRVSSTPQEYQQGVANDAMALERLTAATARTTSAQRAFLILLDPVANDLYLWGAPSARMDAANGPIGEVLRTRKPQVTRMLTRDELPGAMLTVFGNEMLPRTAMLVPVVLEGRAMGVLAAFADKGPIFADEDLEIVRFFAEEAATILQTQRLREAANELEVLREADRLKDEFMAVVSHELRTPLTAISGYADILLRRLSGSLNERQERQVTGIRDAARRLLALINDLLDVSKLEAGTLDLHLGAVDAGAALERAVAGTRVIAAAKGVQLEVREPPEPLPPVRADDERLQQILTNLLVNAIKFTPQGGRVWVGATAEASSRIQGQTEIVFRVEDTGVGLAPGKAERIWDRFYQAESSSTRRFGGVGLGLSIVRRLAELHGGRAEASSAGVDRGSTFIVRLPSAEGAVETTPREVVAPIVDAAVVAPPSLAPSSNGRPLVLVVEDDVPIATVLRTYLESDGYEVDVAGDGQQALFMARTRQPFAITLDISLPRLDGWSVLNALKRDTTTAQIPVIVVSIVDNRDFGMVLGATDYLVKPIDHTRLEQVLQNLRQARGELAASGAILVVDDDPAIRDVLGQMLSDDGWHVSTAEDGDAALAALARERPAAMVLDLMMPRVDGFEVLHTVREQPDLRDLPIIVLTARDLSEDDRRLLDAGVERIVLKQSLRLDDLRNEIRWLLKAGGRS